MLTVHHLNQSRSHRVIWALEELALPYEIVHYQREKNMLAPEALKKVHPLGKSPIIEDNGLILAESGAILEYLQETYDAESRLKPLDPAHKVQYRFWLHYAEGSLMPLLLMKLVFNSPASRPCRQASDSWARRWVRGCRKRISIPSWKRMRALLTRISLKTAGLPGTRSAWPTFR